MTNLDTMLLNDFIDSLQGATGFITEHEALKVPFDDHLQNARFDTAIITKTPSAGVCVLAIKISRTIYPRDARMAISHLMKYQATSPHDNVAPCLIAEMISPGSREALRNAGINYYDKSGTLYFKYHTWLVDVERTPIRSTHKKDIALFHGAREQVIHALLHHWHTNSDEGYITGEKLARLAKTSTYTVSSTMQALEQHDFVESKGSGPHQRRRLRDPASLLDAWADMWTRRREVKTRWYTYAHNGQLTDHVIGKLANHVRQGWALTGAAAANSFLMRLTNVDRIEIIIQPGDTEKLASEIGLSQADKGANIVLIERTGASLLFLEKYPERSHYCFASKFIQYLDLLNGYGRNKELADEFRRLTLKIGNSK